MRAHILPEYDPKHNKNGPFFAVEIYTFLNDPLMKKPEDTGNEIAKKPNEPLEKSAESGERRLMT